jgi:hypothetical protein
MIHKRQRLSLGLETGDHFLGIHTRLDDFQRNLTANRICLLGDINDAHAPFTDLLHQLVRPNHRADLFPQLRHGDGGGSFSGSMGSEQAVERTFEKAVLGFVSFKEIQNSGFEGRVAGAFSTDEIGPFIRRATFQTGVENLPRSFLPVVGHGVLLWDRAVSFRKNTLIF